MAKITFKDEQGQNLNRYKITPTDGTSSFTADLERAANITQQGTPINKETMDNMAQKDDITDLAGSGRTTQTVKGNSDAISAIQSSKGQANGIAPLGSDGKIAKAYIPTTGGYVRQSSAPSDTSLLWVDSANGNIMKYYNGSSWAPVPATWG